jgi:hypothetical protein
MAMLREVLEQKESADRRLEWLGAEGEVRAFSANLCDGSAGEPGFVVLLDERDGRKCFDVFFKGGFVSGSPEEIITTTEQMAKGLAGIKEELGDWLQDPSQSKTVPRR